MAHFIVDGRKQSVTTIVTCNDSSGNVFVLFGRPDPRYHDRKGRCLEGHDLSVGPAQFIGGQVEEHVTDTDALRYESLRAHLHANVVDFDPRILTNALKELSEEAGLNPALHIQEDGSFQLVETLTREGDHADVQDIHYLNLHLGTLSQQDLSNLRDSLKPNDDMIQLLFVPVSALQIDAEREVVVKPMLGSSITKTDFAGFPEIEAWNSQFDEAIIACIHNADPDMALRLRDEKKVYNEMHARLRGLDGIDRETLYELRPVALFRPKNDLIRTDSQILQSFLEEKFGVVLPMPCLDPIKGLLRDVAFMHILPFAGRSDTVSSKDGGSIVTQSDRAVQTALTTALQEMVPGANVTGEENDGSASDLTGRGIEFVIDPIDGTREFVRGGSRFNTMLAMFVNGQPAASWIYFPVNDTLYAAYKGRGVFLNDGSQSISRVTQTVTPQQMAQMNLMNGAERKFPMDSVSVSNLRQIFNDVVPSQWIAGYDIVSILEKRVHALMYGQGKFNDILPWVCFLKEMGYSISDLHGIEYNPALPQNGVIVAPNQETVRAISAALAIE